MTDDDKALVERLRVPCFEIGLDEGWIDAQRNKVADRIEALSAENERLQRSAEYWEADAKRYADNADYWKAENERLRGVLAKSEALQDLAYYNGAKQYASICAQSEDAARDWLNGGCGNRQRDAIAALGDTK